MDEARRTPIPNMAAERDNGELTALLHYIAENDSTIQQERETAILQWEALAQSPEILSRNDNIVANAPEHVKPATQHMNLALLAAMILEAGHDDYTLADEIARGLRLTGDLSSNGVYAPKHDKHKTYIDKDEALAEAQHKRAEMARGREQTEGPYTEVLWKQANEDVTSRKLLGPLNESEMDRVFGGKWLYSHRFPKPEPTKVRAIDDLTKSTVNDMCQINERLYLDDIDSLIALAHTARKADQALNVTHRQYLLWRGDHRDAYRQFPISPEDYSVASIRLPVPRTSQVTPAAQHQAFFIHLRLPFGARGSMLHYTRVGRAVCSILRNIMKIPLLAYVDDYYTLCPVEHAYQCQDIFKRVNDMLRFQIKHEKTMDPTPHGKLLGIELHISPSHISMGIDEDRRSKLKSEIRDVLKQGRLSSTRSSKLAGKLGFAGTAFWGKNGRAYLRALYDRAAGGPPAFTEGHPIARALTWFEWALDNCPRRRIPLGIDQEIITIYTDAEFSVDDSGQMSGRVGSVILLPDSRTRYMTWAVPQQLFAALNQRQTQITPLEVLAVPLSLHHWLKDDQALKGRDQQGAGMAVKLFIDSTAAEGCIRKGSSKHSDINALAAQTWKTAATNNMTIWVDRVASAANPADLPSRAQESLCESMGWTKSVADGDVDWLQWLRI